MLRKVTLYKVILLPGVRAPAVEWALGLVLLISNYMILLTAIIAATTESYCVPGTLVIALTFIHLSNPHNSERHMILLSPFYR